MNIILQQETVINQLINQSVSVVLSGMKNAYINTSFHPVSCAISSNDLQFCSPVLRLVIIDRDRVICFKNNSL